MLISRVQTVEVFIFTQVDSNFFAQFELTDYRLDDPGSNPGGDEFFRHSRPAREPTQPTVKLVPDLSRG